MNKQNVIRLLLVDDHFVVRRGLITILSLENDFSVVGEAEDGRQALEVYRQHTPDVVLMDVRMPGLNGLDAIETIRREFPGAKIIVLTTYDNDEDIHRALKAGARGYLLKNVPGEELVQAIRTVHAGDRWVPPRIAARLVEWVSGEVLTARELEVLRLLFSGLSNKEIAAALAISDNTIKYHLKSIFGKLGARDRTEAVTLALQRGILNLQEMRTPKG
jgi:two-component system NarL family response regulator